jgi:TrmH family RNA methyltransferase
LAVLIDDRHPPLQAWLDGQGVGTTIVSDAVIAAASPVRSPTGVVAIAHWTPAAPVDLIARQGSTRVVGLVDVQDPGNVGTVIRTADAFGASGVLVLGSSANPTSWRTLRAAMGSTFRIPIATGEVAPTLAAARRAGIRIVAATAAGGAAPSSAVLGPPVLMLIGSEGTGLPAELTRSADARVTLPMRTGVESLNAATTASILLWEAARGAAAAAQPT